MKAFVIANAAAQSIVQASVPVPEPGARELLVKMRAIGVGIHDSYYLPTDVGHPFPIGIEGAGIVEQVGGGVTEYRPGDRIAFVSAMQAKGGTWAEHAVVDAEALILRMPDHLDFASAAAIPVAGNTTLHTLTAFDAIPGGGTMFVAGGAGAIGTMAIQLARQREWRVAASASRHNHEYLRSLGAEITVDYHDTDWHDAVLAWAPTGVDAAIAVHPTTTSDTMRVVKDGGVIVTVSGDTLAPERGITVAPPTHNADVRADLEALAADVVAGRIHLEIEQVFPFDKAAEALDRVRSRHVRGKLVLEVA